MIGGAAFNYIGVYRPSDIYASEYYFPYFFISGPLVWLISVEISTRISFLIPSLPAVEGGIVFIIVLPGIFCLILGNMQYYYIGKILGISQKIKNKF